MKKIKIAVVIASMVVEYAHQTLMGLIEEAKKCNVDVHIFNAQASSDERAKHNAGEYNIYNLIDYSAFDGVVFFANLILANSVFDEVTKKLYEIDIPVISVDTSLDGFYHVGIRNYDGMYGVVEHFIEHHGFTRINYISGLDFNTDSQERLAAYRDAMTDHGLKVEERNIFKGPFTQFSGEEATGEMLRRHTEGGEELPQAVVCATDSIAIGVRSMLLRHGYRIPEDVCISGFDNSFEAQNAVPPLTTVDRDQHNIGVQTCRKIVAAIKGEDTAIHELFPAKPVFSGSCGCGKDDKASKNAIRIKYLNLVQHHEQYLYECNAMIEDLNETQTIEDFLEHLLRYVSAVECAGFYLCLDRELLDNMQFISGNAPEGGFHEEYTVKGFPERMAVAMAYENGHLVEYDDFPSAQIWPWNHEKDEDDSNIYVYSPVHFRDRCMGYAIIKNCDFAQSSLLYNAWLVNISNALESLRMQAHYKSMLAELDRMYVIDPLTGLNNRFGFARYTEDKFQHSIEAGESFMVLFADLDGLKRINDHYGHDKGDIAIVGAANVLRNACMDDEVCARFGGDEYVVYAQGYGESDAVRFCKRMEEHLAAANEKLDEEFVISISYGYRIVTPHEDEILDKYIDEADNLMYANKNRKKSELSNK